MRLLRVGIVGLTTGLTLTSHAGAAVIAGPITNPTTGHVYYLLSQALWSDAETQSNALGGHLASINNQAEQDWVFGVFPLPSQANIWLGARDHDTQTWGWVDGSPFTYTNWGGAGGITEPDGNPAVGESFLAMYTPGLPRSGTWADFYGTQTGFYALAEVVPEPTTLLVLAIGATMLLRRHHRC